MNNSIKIIAICALAISTLAFFTCGCADARWPTRGLMLEDTVVRQKIDGNNVKISIHLKDSSVSSAVWPMAKIEQVGDGVIVFKSIRGGAGSLLRNTSGLDEVIVPRVIGKKYTIIFRDEQDNISRLSDFLID